MTVQLTLTDLPEFSGDGVAGPHIRTGNPGLAAAVLYHMRQRIPIVCDGHLPDHVWAVYEGTARIGRLRLITERVGYEIRTVWAKDRV